METYFIHIILSSVCLTVFYLFYILFLRKDTGFKSLRIYFITAICISIFAPFNNLSVNLLPVKEQVVQKIDNENVIKTTINKSTFKVQNNSVSINTYKSNPVDYLKWLQYLYFAILFAIILRFVFGLVAILFIFIRSKSEVYSNTRIVKNERLNGSFAFFNLVFINSKGLNEKDIQGVILHEKIHVSQYHTIDIILVELLSAVMWFNPFVWLLRKSLRQIHEYLADEGVLNIGFDRLEYQALLINQVAESRLLSLTSSFNQSQIKNRIIMMTKRNSDNRTKLKILALVPITAILLFSIACVNGQNKVTLNDSTALMPVPPPPPPPPPVLNGKNDASVAATKMNVLYIGVENPIEISVNEYKAEDIEVKIDNGSITGSNGKYLAFPARTNEIATITVFAKGKKVKESQFRVKTVPDPVAKVAGIKGNGEIKKAVLLAQNGVVAEMENFDFDLGFRVVEFIISANIDGYVNEELSNSDVITPSQKKLIEKCNIGNKVYFENIIAIGPDGTTRQLGTVALKIK